MPPPHIITNANAIVNLVAFIAWPNVVLDNNPISIRPSAQRSRGGGAMRAEADLCVATCCFVGNYIRSQFVAVANVRRWVLCNFR